jgi:hypothetical protein
MVYNGVMYVSNVQQTVAIDVKTGRQIWATPIDWERRSCKNRMLRTIKSWSCGLRWQSICCVPRFLHQSTQMQKQVNNYGARRLLNGAMVTRLRVHQP